MGRGQRHSKNAGIMGSEALTYHERKALGFGTVKERVGKVSATCLLKLFVQCHSLSLVRRVVPHALANTSY